MCAIGFWKRAVPCLFTPAELSRISEANYADATYSMTIVGAWAQ